MNRELIDPDVQDDFDYFGQLDDQTMEAQKRVNEAADSGNKYFDWKKGVVRTLRFYAKRGQVPFLPSKVHWFDDVGDGKAGKLVCRGLVGEPCPTCQYSAELELTGSDDDGKLANKIRANLGWLTLVEDQLSPGSIKILNVPRTLMKALVGVDPESEKTSIKTQYGDFMDPVSGYMVQVVKHDGAPHYTASIVINPKTKMLDASPAKRELGPKLLDLTPEVMVPSLDMHHKMVNYLKGIGEGIRTKEGGFKGGKAQPARVSGAAPRVGLPAQGAAAAAKAPPRAQAMVTAKIDDSFFEEGSSE